jgi:hypothetical protein
MEEFQGNIYVIRNTVFLPSSFGGKLYIIVRAAGTSTKGKTRFI